MTVFNFPDTSGKPTDGTFTWTAPNGLLYSWDGDAWRTVGGSGDGNASITITDDLSTIPAPDAGDLAWHTIEARMYIYYQDDDSQQWVDASPAGDSDSLWERTGTTLSPVTAGDNVNVDGVLTVNTHNNGSRFYEGTGGFENSLVIDGAPLRNASGSIVFTTNSDEVVRIKGDGTSDFNEGKTQILPNGALIAIRDTATDATYGKVTLNGGFANGTRVPFLANGNVGGTVKATFAVESSGTTKIGGTLPDSPNITLDQNGEVRINRAASGSVGIPISILNGLVGVLQVRPDGTTNIGGSLPDSPNITLQADGLIRSVPTYNNTSSSPNDVGISSGGAFYRSTSSIRFKTDVETIEYQYSDAILGCRPVYYRSTCEMDDPSLSHWGFIAEEVGEIDPRLVKWSEKEDGTKQADGVAYDRFVPHLVNLIKRQNTRIEALEAEVQALKGGN